MSLTTRGRKNNYKGVYAVNNPNKWINQTYKEIDGVQRKVVEYLSLWERQTFVYMDRHPDVVKVGAETIRIPYICATDNKEHRYLIDLEIHLRDGTKLAVEIKPKKQTKPPKGSKIETYSKLQEQKTYVKNNSKWVSARKWAEAHGYDFQIWDETVLKRMKILS